MERSTLKHKIENLNRIIKDKRHNEIDSSDRVYFLFSDERKEDPLTGEFFIPLEEAEIIVTIKGKFLQKTSYKDLTIIRKRIYLTLHNFFNGMFKELYSDIVFRRKKE